MRASGGLQRWRFCVSLYSCALLYVTPAAAPGRNLRQSEGIDDFPDLGTLSDQELKDLVRKLRRDEDEISYRRRMLHGRIDILRAELQRRQRRAAEEEDQDG